MLLEVFTTTIISEILLITLLTVSIIYPEKRFWPPPYKWSHQYIIVWALTFISIGGVITLAFIDWDTFIINHWTRYILGSILLLAGNAFALWGLKTLGTHASSGLEHRLIVEGPYRYSRNPQYVGDIIAIIGGIILSNSLYMTITGIIAIIAFLITPLAEEPWLREKYGEEYIEYCKRVPRYL
jgi:protein-S-isoprenylcysteine O-methyltransferase Ste14